jgi:hypothetical protein
MSGKVLDVALGLDRSWPRIHLPLRSADYIDVLQGGGYSQIRLTGLSRLGTKYFDGTGGDEFTVGVDPDVQFLLDYYLRLEVMVEQSRTGLHRVYLADGCFEVSASVEPRKVMVRAGVYRDNPFEPPFADGVVIPTGAYLAMWRSVAAAIVGSCSPDSPDKDSSKSV